MLWKKSRCFGVSKRLNSRAQGGSVPSFAQSGKTKALDEPFNILCSAEKGLISVA